MSIRTGKPIANISCVEIITEEAVPRLFRIKTAKTITPEPFVSEGKESELRARNEILAQNILEDILKGYNIKFKDVVFSPDLLALSEGGVCETDEDGNFLFYRAPDAGAISDRTRFLLRVYSEEKDCDGTSVAYHRFVYPGCFGTPSSFSFEDGEFYTPEYMFKSRAKAGSAAAAVECLDALPVYIESADDISFDLPMSQEYVACNAMTVGGISVKAGDSVYRTQGGFETISPALRD
jgi:hypothetical protein